MPRAKTQDTFTKPTGTVIGKGFTIHATKLIGTNAEAIRIDGTVIGVVDIDGVLNLSDSGYIEGDIKASSARIAGKVIGNVCCNSALHLASTAEVEGDVLTASLIVDDGAVLHGRCQTHVESEASQALTYSHT